MKCHPDLVEYMLIADHPLDDHYQRDYVLELFSDHKPKIMSEYVIYVYGWFKPIYEKFISLNPDEWGLHTDIWEESILL